MKTDKKVKIINISADAVQIELTAQQVEALRNLLLGTERLSTMPDHVTYGGQFMEIGLRQLAMMAERARDEGPDTG